MLISKQNNAQCLPSCCMYVSHGRSENFHFYQLQMDRSQSMSADCKIPYCSIPVWINQLCCMIFPTPLSFKIELHQRVATKHTVVVFFRFIIIFLAHCWLGCLRHHPLKQRNHWNGWGKNIKLPAIKQRKINEFNNALSICNKECLGRNIRTRK